MRCRCGVLEGFSQLPVVREICSGEVSFDLPAEREGRVRISHEALAQRLRKKYQHDQHDECYSVPFLILVSTLSFAALTGHGPGLVRTF
jgi:hypothetical protein